MERARPKPRAGRQVRAKPEGRYHHGDLRRALLDAALLLVEREGRQALTLRAAARLAGVSQAAPYRHFPDKDALLAAAAEDGLRALATWLREAAAQHQDDPARRLWALGVAYVTFAAARPAQFRVMFTAVTAELEAYPSLSAAYEEVSGLLLEAITACQRGGLVQAGDPGPLALSAWAIVHGLADLAVGGQLPRMWRGLGTTQQLAELVTERLWSGLALR